MTPVQLPVHGSSEPDDISAGLRVWFPVYFAEERRGRWVSYVTLLLMLAGMAGVVAAMVTR